MIDHATSNMQLTCCDTFVRQSGIFSHNSSRCVNFNKTKKQSGVSTSSYTWGQQSGHLRSPIIPPHYITFYVYLCNIYLVCLWDRDECSKFNKDAHHRMLRHFQTHLSQCWYCLFKKDPTIANLCLLLWWYICFRNRFRKENVEVLRECKGQGLSKIVGKLLSKTGKLIMHFRQIIEKKIRYQHLESDLHQNLLTPLCHDEHSLNILSRFIKKLCSYLEKYDSFLLVKVCWLWTHTMTPKRILVSSGKIKITCSIMACVEVKDGSRGPFQLLTFWMMIFWYRY